VSADLAFYGELLGDIKTCIQQAQTRALLAVNAELIKMYWEIVRLIDLRQQSEGWGTGVIPRLSRDLHNELPEHKGFSERNIKRMLRFYREYPGEFEKVPQAVAQIPWGHIMLLLEKVKDVSIRFWHVQIILEQDWSRNVLVANLG
jgi:predicted nuclease of restriction endonuclease-like (RecB) superfamily